MKAWGIILAAGSGERLGASKPKALVDLGGLSLVEHSFRAFDEADRCEAYVCVVPEIRDQHAGMTKGPVPPEVVPVGAIVHPDREVYWVEGGSSRQESVRKALAAIARKPGTAEVVVIHDAARPLVTPVLIERALAGLEHAEGAICAVSVPDTLKRVTGDVIDATVARDHLWRAQTPQAFRLDALREAHARAEQEGFEATDDAQLVERYGGKVVIVPGDERNIKITTRADLVIAELLLNQRIGRSGVGYDAHALVEGRPLVLGGVTVPSTRGLEGHSDADVLLHAIADAILGAAALGDIGEHFPSSDERWRGVASEVFLAQALRMITEVGYEIGSIDATVILQAPPLSPHRDEMRKGIAGMLGIDVERVSVKASTTDHLGKIGAGEGIAAVAIVHLEPR